MSSVYVLYSQINKFVKPLKWWFSSFSMQYNHWGSCVITPEILTHWVWDWELHFQSISGGADAVDQGATLWDTLILLIFIPIQT